MGHDKSKYLAWRRRYEPAPVKLIVIAESPPESGKYFYDPEGSHRREILFREMLRVLGVSCTSKDEGLRKFQEAGRILVDATYEPVNDGRSESERNRAILRD